MAYNRVNWIDEPSEDTPITADNLNRMDSQIQINDIIIEKYTVPYELFTGDFTSGSVTLSDSVSNYEMVEVYSNETFTKLYNPSNTDFTLITQSYGVDSTNFAVYISAGSFKVNGNTLSKIRNFSYSIGRSAPNPNSWVSPTMIYSTEANNIHIRKIIGFGKKN